MLGSILKLKVLFSTSSGMGFPRERDRDEWRGNFAPSSFPFYGVIERGEGKRGW